MRDRQRNTEDSLAVLCARVAQRLRRRAPEIAVAIERQIHESVPDLSTQDDPTYQAGVAAAVPAILDYCLDAMESDGDSTSTIPREAVVQTHRAARLGVSVGTVLRRYVAGHRRLGEFVAEEAEALGISDHGPALRHLRRVQEQLLERLTAAIEREYLEARTQMAQGSEHRRQDIVRRLLAEQNVEAAELLDLDYELDGVWHVAIIGTGKAARQRLKRLAGSGWRLLHVPGDHGATWAWVAAKRKLSPRDIERRIAPEWDGDAIALGGARLGLEGWRQTHLEARSALLRARESQSIVRYDERPLLAAALENEILARWLIDLVAPIQARPDGVEILRTLRAYLDSEWNCSSVVPVVKVRRQTVGNRIRLAERLLGCPLRSCFAELDVAIRLIELRSDRDMFSA